MSYVVFKSPRIKKFCDVFVRLWLDAKASGVENPRVGRQAAMMAGYGANSWTAMRSPQAADMMFNKLMKRPDVLEYIGGLGLVREGKRWREAEAQ